MATGMRVGLTGGIGSGKSTVSGMLADLGACVIDADALSRCVTACGGAAIPAITHTFGAEMVGADGALDRAKMRAHVFKEPHARAQLEAIVHPLVGAAIGKATLEADARGAACIVYDIPLLVESGHWRRSLESILVIDCSEATQIRRVMQRNGLRAEEVQAIIAVQAHRSTRLTAADHVLCNDELSLPQLSALVRQIGQKFGL